MNVSGTESSSDPALPFRGLSAFVDRHTVVVYYLALLIVSWTYLFLTVDMGRSLARMVPLALVGPSVLAFLVTFVARGAVGTRELWGRVRRWRNPGWLYALAVLGVPSCFFLGAYAMTASFFPGELRAPAPDALLSTVINFVLLFFLVGLGEEFGWRGLALPRTQRRIGPWQASLLIGVMWFGWHLPVGIGEENWLVQELVFAVSVVAATFFYTWLFNRAGGSVLLVALLHAAENAWATTYRRTFDFEPPGFLYFEGVRALVWVVIAFVTVVLTRGNLGQRGGSLARRRGT